MNGPSRRKSLARAPEEFGCPCAWRSDQVWAAVFRALSFFDDGDLRQLPDDTKLRLVTAARNVDLDRLPGLDNADRNIDQDHGL